MMTKPIAAGSAATNGRVPMTLLEPAYKVWNNDAMIGLRNARASKQTKPVVR